MSKKKDSFNGLKSMFEEGKFPKPPVPPVPFGPFGKASEKSEDQDSNKEKNSEKKENIKSVVKSYWTQNIDMQKSSVENKKKQWNQFFDYMMEAQDTFTESIPDDTSSMPFGKIINKSNMKRLKEFQEMANEHFVEQADSFADFMIKGQEQVYDMVSSAMESKKAGDSEAAEAQE